MMNPSEEITYVRTVPHDDTETLTITIEAQEALQARITLDNGDHRVQLTGDEFDEIAGIVAVFRKMRAAASS